MTAASRASSPRGPQLEGYPQPVETVSTDLSESSSEDLKEAGRKSTGRNHSEVIHTPGWPDTFDKMYKCLHWQYSKLMKFFNCLLLLVGCFVMTGAMFFIITGAHPYISRTTAQDKRRFSVLVPTFILKAAQKMAVTLSLLASKNIGTLEPFLIL
ncbi:uncharacterized protein LOC101855485 [Aplysia californica]|uniref:Uncharacterized protein LOC101855485 n=1 Tax=Aplysia californica TaxID=6500 RepID=A0ABM1VRZ2_APLCA|nr:uncharacterized protein LOC101855485 [Aplysia californica]